MPLVLENISYSYLSPGIGEIPALRNINIKINEGEFIGITGHTGSGKSSLIQIMTGLLIPDSGKILLDGMDINDKNYDRGILRSKTGIVFQFPEYQLFETTVEKDLLFGLKYSGLSADEKKERIRWALNTMGITDEKFLKKNPHSLSGGEKRLAAIMGALVTRPAFLIFDEPTASLDPVKCRFFIDTVKSLNESGICIIIVTHNIDMLLEHANRIIVLNEGSLAMDTGDGGIAKYTKFEKDLHFNTGNAVKIRDLLSQRGIELKESITGYTSLLNALHKHLYGSKDI